MIKIVNETNHANQNWTSNMHDGTGVPPDQFDTDPNIYGALINWPKRLANESPFYRDLFDRVGAARIVDVACGMGYHAALFRSWGMYVEAADISPEMIRRAREVHGESPDLRWIVRGFEEPVAAKPPFDVAICVGNSMALAGDIGLVRRAIHHMLESIRIGGVMVVQLLNLWRLPDGPCVWQKFVHRKTADGDVLIVKGVHRAADQGFVDILVVPAESDSQPETRSVPFLGLRAETLHDMASAAGARQVEFYGGYHGEDYDLDSSIDLIAVARK